MRVWRSPWQKLQISLDLLRRLWYTVRTPQTSGLYIDTLKRRIKVGKYYRNNRNNQNSLRQLSIESAGGMKIALVSDIHGTLPMFDYSAVDGIIIAGDILPNFEVTHQQEWYDYAFLPWLNNFPQSVFIAGNHCFAFEEFGCDHPSYLQDSAATLCGLRVWGTPWTKNLPGRAFQKTEKEMESVLTAVDNCDILVTHSPPLGILDRANDGELCGYQAITNLIDRIKPKLSVHGHIHEAQGYTWYRDTLCVNAAVKDERYILRKQVPVIDTDDWSFTLLGIENAN